MSESEPIGPSRLVDGQLVPVIEAEAPWAVRLATDLSASDHTSSWCQLVELTDETRSRSKPTQRWLASARAVIASIGEAELVSHLAAWLELLAEPPQDPARSHRFLEGNSGTLLRGLIWASTQCDSMPPAALGSAAAACLVKVPGHGARSIRVAHGCLWALGERDTHAAIAELLEIKWSTDYVRTTDLVARLLADIARRRDAEVVTLEALGKRAPSVALNIEGTLRLALDAVHKGEPSAALEALGRVWRVSKDERVAALIASVGSVVSQGLDALDGPGEDAISAQFETIASAANPADIDRLSQRFPCSNARSNLKRAEALARFPDDPRLARAFARAIASGSAPRLVFNTLVRIADPGVIPILERADFSAVGHDEIIATVTALRDQCVAAIAARGSSLDLGSDARDLIGSIESALGPAAPTEGLLEAIYADPRSDELRLVYADMLSEKGDPRGELIALQMAGALDRKQRARVAALEREHRTEWLGPLADALQRTSVQFERGFPARAGLRKDPRRAAALVGRPEWSTLVELDLRHSSFYGTILPVRFLLQPCMRHLEIARNLFFEQLLAILEHTEPLALREISFTMQRGDHSRGALDTLVAAMNNCTSVPALRRIDVSGCRALGRLGKTRLAAQLERINGRP